MTNIMDSKLPESSESETTKLNNHEDQNPSGTDGIKNSKKFPSEISNLKGKFLCSFLPQGKVGEFLSWLMTVVMIWGVLISITGDQALPGGNLFSILSLLVLAHIGGYIVSIINLPPLLGMLLVGIILRSVPHLEIIGENIDQKWSSTLRKTALVIILTRAGLGLDAKALRQLSLTVLRLGILPNIVEMAAVSTVVHFLLGFPWLWSVMLGFIISGVSPSVVVPCMLNLADNGYGLNKGIPTLVIAGLSIDNVISISGFGVMLGLIFSEGSVAWQAIKGPLEVLGGLVYGIALGVICSYLPPNTLKGSAKFKFVLIFGAGLLALFGSMKIGYGGAGPIGCLTTAFVASIGWKKQGQEKELNMIKKNFNFLWQFFLPLLFGLIGNEIQVSALEGKTVLFGLLTLLISLFFRILTTYFCVLGGNLNVKERLFVSLAWLPKATIQAAIGSTALDIARSLNEGNPIESYEEKLGKQVLTIAVLVILVSAPIGAASIMLAAPKLLKKNQYREVAVTDKDTEMQNL